MTTRFIMGGSPEQAGAFFRDVIANLAQPAIERLEQERKVLEVESQKAQGGQLGFDLSVRFGARGPGLVGWPEYGLQRVTGDDVAAWATQWFTATNAVLWLSAPPPPELDLSALPRGASPERRPCPDSLCPKRSWAGVNTTMVSLSVLSDQHWALMPMLSVARDRALDRLRQERAISYSVNGTHVRLPGGRALEFFLADGAADAHGAVIEGLLGVLESLVESGPTDAELEMWNATREQFRDAPAAILGQLDGTAERKVLGLEALSPHEVEARVRSLTVDQMRQELSDVLDTTLVIGPAELGQEVEGLATLSDWSEMQALGDEYAPIDGRERGTLVLGDDAISWILDDAHFRTIRWDEVAAVTTWDNGHRTIIGSNGSRILVAPWNWREGERLPALIDGRAGPARLVRLGEGTTEYQRDGADTEWVADLRWLASLIGVHEGKETADLVLLTDGLLLLYRTGPVSTADRLKELRRLPKEKLVEMHPRSRWWPLHAIESVELSRSRLPRLVSGKQGGRLQIQPREGDAVVVTINPAIHMKTVTAEFPKVFGGRFHSAS